MPHVVCLHQYKCTRRLPAYCWLHLLQLLSKQELGDQEPPNKRQCNSRSQAKQHTTLVEQQQKQKQQQQQQQQQQQPQQFGPSAAGPDTSHQTQPVSRLTSACTDSGSTMTTLITACLLLAQYATAVQASCPSRCIPPAHTRCLSRLYCIAAHCGGLCWCTSQRRPGRQQQHQQPQAQTEAAAAATPQTAAGGTRCTW